MAGETVHTLHTDRLDLNIEGTVADGKCPRTPLHFRSGAYVDTVRAIRGQAAGRK